MTVIGLPEKSKGHLAFVRFFDGSMAEFWVRDRIVWKAAVGHPVMPDGYRCGRFACWESQWPFEQSLLADHIISNSDGMTPKERERR